jgi:signal transduction histidine kinase/ligand-binding sensor domain-containing protein
MKIKFVLLAVTLQVFLFAKAEQLNVAPGKLSDANGKFYLFHNYTTKDGLVNNGIMTINQDRLGYVWIGSDLGITRFDGKSFYKKAVPEIYDNSAFVEYIEQEPNGNIITTAFMQGVFVQQPNGHFRQYYSNPKRVGRNIFNTLKYSPDGKLWIGAAHLVYLLKNDSLSLVFDYGSNQQVVTTLDLSPDKTLWFGGSLGLGVFLPDGKKLKPHFFPELKDKLIIKILFDSEGRLHVATSQGYYLINFSKPFDWKGKYSISQPFAELEGVFINHLYIDSQKNLWIPTSTKGVYRTSNGQVTLHLTTENGLISSTVMCLFNDREGNYWFGTDQGVSMIGNFDNYALSFEGKRFKDASNMVPDRFGRIWLPRRDALYVFQNGQLSKLDFKGTALYENGINSLRIDSDSVMWIANHSAIFSISLTANTLDLKKIKKIADFVALGGKRLKSTFIDQQNRLWVCMQNRIFAFDHGKMYQTKFNHPDSVNLRPSTMAQDKYGNYWIGDFIYGLYRATPKPAANNTIVLDNVIAYKSLKPDSSFVNAWIQDLTTDKNGDLWQASLYSGAYKLRLDEKGVKSFTHYTISNGLTDNMITGIIPDTQGNVWFTGQKGINMLTTKDGHEKVNRFDETNGFEGQGLNVLVNEKKRYLMTDEGIFVTRENENKNTTKDIPRVFITNFYVNGIIDTTFIQEGKSLKIKPGKNNVSIEFSSITFRRAKELQFQYRLEGAESSWSTFSDRQFVEYPSLMHRKYVFHVRAKYLDGETGPETLLQFVIRPEFYQTPWFYFFIIVLLLFATYLIYRYRLAHALKMEKMRTRIAADLHDDIGSTLSSISIMSELIAGDRNIAGNHTRDMVSKIGINSRTMLNAMDDIIWSVNPKNDRFTNLELRLKEFAIPLFEPKGTKISFDIDESIQQIKMDMDQRRNIYLIAKEALNNAAKYSEATLVSVCITITHQYIKINVEDNGKGFDPNASTNRNGLANMERRSKQMGALFSIESHINKGTLISLRIRNPKII